MKHILNYETYNESKLRNFATGAMLLASLLGSPSNKAYAKGDDIETIHTTNFNQNVGLIDKEQYSKIENNLEKMNYQIYGVKPQFDSHKFVFSTSLSHKLETAINQAAQQSEAYINKLYQEDSEDSKIDAGYQHIYYTKVGKSSYQVVIITEIVSEEEEGREYDKSVGVFRGL